MNIESLKQLYTQDVEKYGVDNAHKYWQWQPKKVNAWTRGDWFDCTMSVNFSCNLNYRRKL